MAKRPAGRGHQYMIKWLNYKDTENTWEAASSVRKTAQELVDAYERGDSPEAQQAAARDARAKNREEFKSSTIEEVAEDVDASELASAVEGRLRKYMAAMTGKLLDGFESRLPVPSVMVALREIFDYRRMPLNDKSNLESWSDKAIDELVPDEFPELDVAVVKDEALRVRFWLADNKARFLEDVTVLDRDGNEVKTQEGQVVTKQQLKICGEGSIMKALFTEQHLFPAGVQSYLHVADYMISYETKQSHTERAGRNMNLTKSPDRASLGDDNFKTLVWLSFNAPPPPQVDFAPFVSKWLKHHKLACFKEGGESKVLDRKKSECKNTILK